MHEIIQICPVIRTAEAWNFTDIAVLRICQIMSLNRLPMSRTAPSMQGTSAVIVKSVGNWSIIDTWRFPSMLLSFSELSKLAGQMVPPHRLSPGPWDSLCTKDPSGAMYSLFGGRGIRKLHPNAAMWELYSLFTCDIWRCAVLVR